MIYIAILVTVIAILIFMVISTALGSLATKQRELVIEKKKLELQLEHSKLELQQQRNSLEIDYLEGLKQEEQYLIKRLDELDLKSLPTHEQMNKALWYLKQEGSLSQQECNKIIKLYDIKRLFEMR